MRISKLNQAVLAVERLSCVAILLGQIKSKPRWRKVCHSAWGTAANLKVGPYFGDIGLINRQALTSYKLGMPGVSVDRFLLLLDNRIVTELADQLFLGSRATPFPAEDF